MMLATSFAGFRKWVGPIHGNPDDKMLISYLLEFFEQSTGHCETDCRSRWARDLIQQGITYVLINFNPRLNLKVILYLFVILISQFSFETFSPFSMFFF